MKEKIIILLILFLFLSCSKPFVGKRVGAYNEIWCECRSESVAICETKAGEFDFSFTISKVTDRSDDAKVESYVEGSALWNGYQGFTVTDSTFAFVLADNHTVTDYIGFRIFAQGLDRALQFKKTFISDQYDAIAIIWKMNVQD